MTVVSRKPSAHFARIMPSVFLLPLAFMTTCSQFKVGLGTKVDVNPPSIEISSPANGSYKQGAITLSGTASDDIGLANNSISIAMTFSADSGIAAKTFDVPVSGGAWTLLISTDTADLAAGKEVNVTIIATASDNAGKSTEQKIIIYLDNKAPTVKLTGPTAEDLATTDYYVNGSIQFRGSADADTASLVLEAGGRQFSPVNGNNASFKVQVDTQLFVVGEGGVTDGGGAVLLVPFKLFAIDNAGNRSVEYAGSLRLKQSSDVPVISFKGPDKDIVDLSAASMLLATNQNIFAQGDSITGTLSDDDGIDYSSLSLKLTPMLSDGVTEDRVSTPVIFIKGAADPLHNIGIKTLGTNSDPSFSTSVTSASFSFTVPASLAQGIYRLSGSLSDSVASKIAPLASSSLPDPAAVTSSFSQVYFVVDNGKPVTRIAQPVSGSFLRTLAANGTAEEGLGIKRVEYQLDSTSGVWTGIDNPAPGASTSFSWSMNGPTLSEGNHSLYVRSVSTGNATGSISSVDFSIDTTPPTAGVQSVAPASGDAAKAPSAFEDASLASAPDGYLDTVNGMARFKGVAADTASLASLSWSIRHVASIATTPWTVDPSPVDSGTFAKSSMSLWSLVVDTTDSAKYSDKSYYQLVLRATDQAGNATTTARAFRVDQSGDLPVISLSNMKASAMTSAAAKLNLLFANLELGASISDDDRVSASSVSLYIDEGTSGTAHPVSGSTSGSGIVTFSYSLSSLSQGRHYFWLKASDDAAWKNGVAAASSVVGPVYFAIDTVQPTVRYDQSLSSYDHVAHTMSVGGTISTSNLLDDSAPLTVTWSGGQAAVTPTVRTSGSPNAWNWSYQLDVASIPDGSFSMTSSAMDEFGLSGAINYAITVDKAAPVVTVTNQATVFSEMNGNVLFGTAMDQTTGVSSMTAVVKEVLSGADCSAVAAFTASSGTGNPGSGGGWSLDTTALPTGSYAVALGAIDKVGNSASFPTFSIIVDRDLPTAAISAVGGNPVDGALYNAASGMSGNWSGTVGDAYFKSGEVDLDGAKIADIAAKGPWNCAMNWAAISEGTHTLSVKAADQGGHLVIVTAAFVKDTVAPTLAISNLTNGQLIEGATYSAQGSASDAVSGVSAIQYRLNGGGWNSASGSNAWTAAVGGLLDGLSQTLEFRAADVAGNQGAITARTISVDLAYPLLSEVTVGGASLVYRNADLPLAGAATDGNGVSHVVVSYQKDGGAAVQALDDTGNDGSWGWTLSAPSDHSMDGVYDITIVATDGANKSSILLRRVMIDTRSPDLSISAPVDAEFVTLPVYTIRGQVNDNGGKGVTSLSWSLDNLTWTPITLSGLNWSAANIDVGLGGEGAKLLRVKANDGPAFNPDSTAQVGFSYDKDPPAIDETKVATTAQVIKAANFRLEGDLADTNALKGLAISASRNGTGVGVVKSTAYTIEKTAAFVYDKTVAMDGSDDGLWIFTLTATDAADRTSTITRTVLVDTTKPAVPTIDALSDPYYDASLPVSGSAGDGAGFVSGVASVQYSFTNSGSDWTSLIGTDNWYKQINIRADSPTTPIAAEGVKALYVRALDRAGNASDSASMGFTVDRLNPLIGETSYTGVNYRNTDFVLSLGVDDSFALGAAPLQATLKVDNVDKSISAYPATLVSGGGTKSQVWSQTIPTLFGDGVYEVSLHAQDLVGRSANTLTRSVTVDSVAPVISVAGVSPITVGGKINGMVSVTGNATDANPIDHLYWTTAVDDSAWTEIMTGISSWSLLLDTRSVHTSNLRLKAVDRAGNPGLVTLALAIDQATDNPAFAITNAPSFGASEAEARANSLGSGAKIYAKATDDDWVDTSTLKISIDGGAYAAVETAAAAAQSVDFSHGLSGLSEGIAHTLALKVSDQSDKKYGLALATTTTSLYYFIIDKSPPSVTITPPATAYFKNTLDLSGSAADGNTVSSVDYSFDSSTWTPVSTFSWNGATHQGAWTLSGADISTRPQGSQLVYLRSTDEFGKVSTEVAPVSVAITKDTVGPTISVSGPGDGAHVNGSIELFGTTVDTEAYGDSYWWIGSGGAPGSLAGWTKFSGTSSSTKHFNWSHAAYDTTGLLDGSYSFRVRAFDAAGNQSDAVQALEIDQSTDIPVITLQAIDASKAAKVNRLSANPSVSGTISDDDGVDVSTIRISFDGSTWIPPSNPPASNSLSVSFTHTLSLAQAAEGLAHQLYVKANDIYGKPVTEISQGGSTYASCPYWVDAGAPTIAFLTPSPNSFCTGSLSLTGTVEDGSVVSSVRVSLDGGLGYSATGVSFAPAQGGGGWSWSGSVADKADGDFTLKIQATDEFGNVKVSDFQVKIDKVFPTLTFLSPTVSGSSVNGSLLFTGSASDANGLGLVKYWIGTNVGTPPVDSAAWLAVGGSLGNWSVYLDTTGMADLGHFRLWIRALDSAGNSIDQPFDFIVDQSSDAPVIAFSLPSSSATTVFNAIPVTASGTLSDDDGIKSLEYRMPGDSGWTLVQSWSSPYPTTAQPWSFSMSSISNGTGKTFSLRATDAKNETSYYQRTLSSPVFTVAAASPEVRIDTPLTAAYFNGASSMSVSGMAEDGNAGGAITAVAWALDSDATWTTFDTGSYLGSHAWAASVPVPAGKLDGVLKIRIMATNDTGKYGIATVDVNVDKTRPALDSLAFNKILAGDKVNGVLKVSGSASDNAGLDHVVLGFAGTRTDDSDYIVSSNQASVWTDIPITTTLLKAGSELTITAEAVDKAGNHSLVSSRTVTVDQSTNLPSIAFSNLPGDGYFRGGGSIIGTITDDDGVASVRFNVDGSWGSAVALGGSLSENYAYTFTSLADGLHSIVVEATDSSGTSQDLATSPTVSYRIDRANPLVGVASPANDSYQNAAFLVTGTSSDANDIAKVEFSVNNGTIYDTATKGSFNPATGGWTAEIDASLGSGPYSITVRATDNSGNISQVSTRVIMDLGKPTVAFTAPAANAVTNGTVSVTGTTEDLQTSVKTVLAKIDKSGTDLTVVGLSPWSISLDTALYDNVANATLVSDPDSIADSGDETWAITLDITVVDQAGNQSIPASSQLTFKISQAANAPVISYTNLAADGSTYYASDGSVTGSITDDDGVASIDYTLDSLATQTLALGGAKTETWAVAYSALGEGLHTIKIKAYDTLGSEQGSAEGATISFRIDRLSPTLAIVRPLASSLQKSDFSVTGSADDANGLFATHAVRIKVDSGLPTDCSYDSGAKTWSATVSKAGLIEGIHTVTVVAKDSSGKLSQATRDFTLDTTLPEISVITPDNGANVNGKVVFKGTTSDTNGIEKVEYKIGKDSNWYAFTGTYNWQKDFPVIDSYGTDTYADETAVGSNIWRLTLHLRVTDKAGNIATRDDYQLIVDPAHDMPVVDFVQPVSGDTVGGVVRISGTSYDDDAVKRVEIAFDMNGDNDFDDAGDLWAGHTALSQVAVPGGATETFADASTKGWYAVNQSAGSWANWYTNINKDGEFPPLKDGSDNLIPYHIKVRAIDTKDGTTYGIAGLPQAISVVFDANVPRIENLGYTSGSIVGGLIHVTATVKDESGISYLRFIHQGPLNATGTLIDNGAVNASGPATLNGQATLLLSGDTGYESGYVKYRVDVPIDTSQAGLFPSGSGVMNMTVEATDTSGHITQTYLNLQVDNLFPTGAYTNTTGITVNSTSYRQMVGLAYNLQGTASDSGTVKGIDRIVSYIVRGTSVYDLRSSGRSTPILDATALPAATTITAGSLAAGTMYLVTGLGTSDFTAIGAIRNEAGAVFQATGPGSGTGTAVALSQAYVITTVGTTDFTQIGALHNSVGTVFAPTGPAAALTTGKALPADYAIFIDKFGESGNDGGSGGDRDGYNEDLSLSGSTYNWYAQVNSKNITDGAVEIHYSALDRGGNATPYTELGFVANKLPSITGVTLGTDLNGNADAHDSGETTSISLGYETTGFTVRGHLLSFTTTVLGGNLPLTYSLRYGSTTLSDTSSSKLLGDGATFPIGDTIVDGSEAQNLALFTVSVVDNVGLPSGDLVVRMNIDNVDDINPGIVVVPIGKRYPTGTDAAKVLHGTNDVDHHYDNLVAATPADRSTWEGHVEPAVDSLYDNSGSVGDLAWDADVSGKVKLRGKVYDNQRIKTIQVAFSKAFDANNDGTYETAAGSPITIAHWNALTSALVEDWSTTLVGTGTGHNWAFHLEDRSTPEVDLANGHATNWSFEWNSAGISGVTGKDVVATFTVTDANSKTGSSAIRMDVAPYVMNMRRAAAYNTIRSRQGRYAFYRGENATFNGFNLFNSTSDTLTLGSSAGISLPSGGKSTTFTVAVPADATSGAVTLNVSGVGMLNNANANTKDWNKESTLSAALDGSGLWTDDRAVHIWQSNSTATGSDRGYFVGSDAPVYPAMSYNSGSLYASWSNYSTANVYYGTNAAGAATIYHSYDPLEHTDISFGARATVVYNANTYGNSTWSEAGAGGVQIYDVNAPNNTDGTGTWKVYDMEELFHNQMLMQFTNERVVNHGSDIHISYYDTKDKSLKYAYVANGDALATEHQNWINLDGGSDANDTSASGNQAYSQTATATNTTYLVAAATGNGLNVTSTLTGAITNKATVPGAFANGANIMRVGGTWVTMPAAGYLTTMTAAASLVAGTADDIVATYRPNVTTVTTVLASVGQYVTAGTVIATAATGTVNILAAANGYIYSILAPGAAITSGTTTVAATSDRKILSAVSNATAVVVGDALYTYSNDGSTVNTVYASTAGTVSATTAANTVLAGGATTVVSTTGLTRLYGGTRSSAAGEYSAIDVTPTDHFPVIAYYDIANQTLKLAYARTSAPGAGADWTTQNVMDSGTDPNYRYSGKYVSMKIDPDGYLHIVFYRNSTGDLVYIKSSNSPTDGKTAYLFGSGSQTIDSIGAVGVWADISIGPKDVAGNYVPCISYLDSSYTNTFDAVKLAYFDTSLVDAVTGNNGWEYMNAALAYEVENVRTSVEFDTGTSATLDNGGKFWKAAIGYQSSDYYRIAYYVK